MTAQRWDPAQYGVYGGERSTPFFDLVARITTEAPRRVVDLGSGPGQLPATLARRWPGAEVVGIDSSHEMIAAARGIQDAPDNLRFEHGAIEDWSPSSRDDVVVANAALQWVPAHRDLLSRWFAALPAGASFAMQVPGNFAAPSHELLREVAATPRWAARLGGMLRGTDSVGEPVDYLRAALDAGLGATAWETTYLQVLPGDDPVLEWTTGTALTPVRAALDDADFAEFTGEYGARLREAYPREEFGTVYPFRRIFLVATR
jgi:trans-aconitate 2-methyltransferase